MKYIIFLAPSIAPENITIVLNGSSSLKVNWSPPPLSEMNGILLGYKIWHTWKVYGSPVSINI